MECSGCIAFLSCKVVIENRIGLGVAHCSVGRPGTKSSPVPLDYIGFIWNKAGVKLNS